MGKEGGGGGGGGKGSGGGIGDGIDLFYIMRKKSDQSIFLYVCCTFILYFRTVLLNNFLKMTSVNQGLHLFLL